MSSAEYYDIVLEGLNRPLPRKLNPSLADAINLRWDRYDDYQLLGTEAAWGEYLRADSLVQRIRKETQ